MTVLSRASSLSMPMLSEEEETVLVRAWQDRGCRKSLDALVVSHMRVCFAVAARYSKNEAHVKDLAQSGVIGLMMAADRFDATRGVRFAHYARLWVKSEVSKTAALTSLVVDMPPRLYMKARSPASNDDVGWKARQAARTVRSFDTPMEIGGDTTFGDMLPSSDPDPEAVAMDADKRTTISSMVSDGMKEALSERESIVLTRRTLIDPGDTLETIAVDMGLSRERIRQIEMAASEKLRKWLLGRFPRHLLCS